MASLVLGTAGSIIGSAIGGPIGGSIGYLIGSTLGSLIDPPKVEGPRMSDLKLQHSTYGSMIPVLYGTKRVAGNVIWQTDLVEHKHKSGGKGGPQVTTYTYSASWAVLLCEGPILGVRKLWADGRLISSTGESTDDLPFVLYKGTETQLPDPTMEAEEGAGEVNANRGVAYIVFTDVDLTDYGNRIFQLEAEVEASGAAKLARISEFTPQGNNTSHAPGFPLDNAYLDGNQVVQCVYTNAAPPTYQEFRYDLISGDLLETGPLIDIENPLGAGAAFWSPSTNSNVSFAFAAASGSGDVGRWYVAGVRGVEMVQPPQGSDGALAVAGRPYKFGDFMYAPGMETGGGKIFIGKWGFRDSENVAGVPEVDFFDVLANASLPVTASNNISITFDEEGYLWAYSPGSAGHGELFKLDPDDMSLVRHIVFNTSPMASILATGSNFSSLTFYRGMVLAQGASGTAKLYRINDDDTFTELDAEPVANGPVGFTAMLNLGGGYVLTTDGVLRIGSAEILGNIVADVSERCGLLGGSAAQYDVSDLTEEVYGYVIANQMTGKNAIEPLRALYLFDGAEVDDVVLFKHRDADPVEVIPDDDLGVHDLGSQATPLLEHIRTPESELPRTVNLVYLNADTDYQAATQYARRETGASELDTSLNVPIVLVDAEARERVNGILYSAWIERTGVTFNLTRKWAALVPTDVVTVQGYRVRITQVAMTVSGIMQCSGLLTRAIVFDQDSIVQAPGGGFTPPTPGTATRANTQLVLLDIPLQSSGDYVYGFYSAGGPLGAGAWGGYTLYKSVDGGTTYKEIASTDTAAVIGLTTTAVAPFSGGSLVYDLAGFTVVLSDDDAELTSCSSAAIEADQNKFCISATGAIPWKFGRFMTATLTADRTYDLTGILWDDDTVAAIAAGATFVMIDDVERGRMVLNVDAPQSELNLPFLYKAVTFGKTLAEAPAITFTNTGEGADSYGPPATALLDTFIGDNITGPAPRKGLVPAPWVGAGAAEAVLLATSDPSGSAATYWGVPSWGGGGSISDGDKGDITVSGSGSVWNIDAGAVGNPELADMAQSTIKGRAVGAGTGDPTDLTATQATAILDNLVGDTGAGGLKGLAPAPAAGDAAAGKVLSADGQWHEIADLPAGSLQIFGNLFGPGTAGAVVFDGVGAVADWTLTGSTYTPNGAQLTTGDLYATDMTISSGVTVETRGVLLFATGTLTNNGTITATNVANRNASGATAGGIGSLTIIRVGNGGAGATGTINAANGTGTTNSVGGSGGAGGSSGSAGGTGGVANVPIAIAGGVGWMETPFAIYYGWTRGNNTYTGGGGGGSGRGNGAAISGGGGGAGGPDQWIAAHHIAGNGTLALGGGVGGTPVGAGNAGGGGGGGGGGAFMTTAQQNWQSLWTVDVAGGAPGSGIGTGNNGSPGVDGRILEWFVTA